MTLFESGDSSGKVSLKQLFNGNSIEPVACETNLDQIAYLICRGGWPMATFLSGEIALDQAFDYVDSVAERDIQRVDGVKRSPERTRLLLRSYALSLRTWRFVTFEYSPKHLTVNCIIIATVLGWNATPSCIAATAHTP